MIKYEIHGHSLLILAPAITPELLAELSQQLFEDYKNSGSKGLPYNDLGQTYNGELHDQHVYADMAARHMKEAGLGSAKTYWGFSVIPPLQLEPGQKITVPEGLDVKTSMALRPGLRKRVNSRDQVVEVEGVTAGYYCSRRSGEVPWIEPKFHWTSMGGKATHRASVQELSALLHEKKMQPEDGMAP